MITGFRLGPGAVPASALGVTPDLWCFGKVIGGGLPLGAFGGRAELAEPPRARRAPSTRPARCRGTRSPPPPGARCSGTVDRRGLRGALGRGPPRFAADLERADRRGRAGGPGAARSAPWSGSWWHAPGETPPGPADLADVRAVVAGPGPTAACSTRSWRSGVALAPGPYEVLFPGLAHDEAEPGRGRRGGRRGGGRGGGRLGLSPGQRARVPLDDALEQPLARSPPSPGSRASAGPSGRAA